MSMRGLPSLCRFRHGSYCQHKANLNYRCEKQRCPLRGLPKGCEFACGDSGYCGHEDHPGPYRDGADVYGIADPEGKCCQKKCPLLKRRPSFSGARKESEVCAESIDRLSSRLSGTI